MLDKSQFIKLTIGVYKVSELFPKREPLKFLLRKKVDEILANLVVAQFYQTDKSQLGQRAQARALEQVIKQIAVLEIYYQVAEAQNWARPENFWLLKTEYLAIQEEAKQMLAIGARLAVEGNSGHQASSPAQPSQALAMAAKPKAIKPSPNPGLDGLKDRHKKILQILRQKDKAQIRDFNKVLPEVTKRTLRRDLDFLLKQGLVVRFGDKSKTEYKIK